MAQRFGAQKLIAFSVGLCGLVTMLIPTAATYGGWQAVIVLRILTGCCQGVVPPCIHNLLSKWIPLEERGRAGNKLFSIKVITNSILETISLNS